MTVGYITFFLGGAVVCLGLLLGAATMPAESRGVQTMTPIAGQCWTGGCARAVV